MTDDTDTLKARRQQKTKPVVTAGNTVLSAPPEPREPTSIGDAIANSRSKILFAPGEHPPIVQSGGFVPRAQLGDLYVEADCDVTETVVPYNAKTPISRMLWTKGSLIRKDIYAQWEAIRDAAAEFAAAAAEFAAAAAGSTEDTGDQGTKTGE
jgi:hypothetical protein